MSGGHFEHKQRVIDDIADEVEQLIRTNSDYKPETIQRFGEAVKALRLAAVYAQRIDWLVSGDDSEGTFHARLKAELENLHVLAAPEAKP